MILFMWKRDWLNYFVNVFGLRSLDWEKKIWEYIDMCINLWNKVDLYIKLVKVYFLVW